MFRKPAFWIAFVVVAVLCVAFSFVYFPRAFPLVTLDLQMDRETALERARQLAGDRGWGPEGYRQAASFGLDSEVQSFVELEGGGKQAWAEMLAGELYSPYTWQVRLFKEFETNETTLSFTPAGEPYGFVEKLPEDQPGAALDGEAAREIAERAAAEAPWRVDFSSYQLAEDSKEILPSDRVDHTFVYERPAPTVGEEGRYRLQLKVSGDRFTELSHLIKVPEAFTRRYEEMRSANNGIAIGATVVVFILYLLVGCVIGLFLLLRKRWVLWKQPVKWAALVAFLGAMVVFNQWPLAWMGYDTAVSATNFALQQVVFALIQFFGMGLVMAASFMAAESLTRRAFPNQVQLWKSWTPAVASSPTIAGLTAAGFLLVGVFFAYDVLLYYVAQSRLGWWSPSGALFNPDVLATYFPWLSSVAISLQAGFWEECLFRAVPIAGAALIGDRLGGRKWWILGALVLQAVVFGAGHANYPAQPAYARLVELIIPAVGFGLIYLAWGLLPAIILHFAFDVVWFALPLFAASSPGIWIDRGLVILLTLIPVWVVLRGRLKSGAWKKVDEEAYNRAWEAPPAPEAAPDTGARPMAIGLASRTRLVLLSAGVVGLVAWFAVGDFSPDAPAIVTGRAEGLSAARAALDERGAKPPAGARELSRIEAVIGTDHRFVWQEGGEESYRELLAADYLDGPQRLVRYASFEGDVAERAEEYRVWMASDGRVLRFSHSLPEGRSGASLEEPAARELARSTIGELYGLDPDALDEVSAEPEKQPARRDWRFVYSDPGIYPLEEGEARIAVELAGDEVADSYRFVHVPEEWERSDRNRGTATGIVQAVCVVVLVLLFVAGSVVAIVRWSRGRFAVGAFAFALGLLVVLGIISTVNAWPIIASNFSSAQPYMLQLVIFIVGPTVFILATASAISLVVGAVHRWLPAQPAEGGAASLAAGAALGAALAGVAALAAALSPAFEPWWPSFDEAGAFSPLLATALGPISGWITTGALILLLVALVNSLTRYWTRWRLPFSILLVAMGFVLVGSEGVSTVPGWLAAGLITGLLLLGSWLFVLRFHAALVLPAAAMISILAVLREGAAGAYPGVMAGSVIASLLIAAAAIYWFGRLTRDTAAGAEEG